jgi:hypothetical protein
MLMGGNTGDLNYTYSGKELEYDDSEILQKYSLNNNEVTF